MIEEPFLVIYSMPRNHKKREDTFSLINLHELNRLRQDKEKIVNSPVEENWKKAIVMEELLHLHQKNKNASSTVSQAYSKAQYLTWEGINKSVPSEENPWNDNQDHQIGKYQKMYDGLNRWQEHFQNFNIGKVLQRVDRRVKKPKTISNLNGSQMVDERLRQRKVSKVVKNIKGGAFGSFYRCFTPKGSFFRSKRQEVEKLRINAINKYGLNFSKNVSQDTLDCDFQAFKSRDQEIFEQFTESLNNSRIVHQKPYVTPRRPNITDDRIDLRQFGRPISNETKVLTRTKTGHKKRYIRLGC